MKRALLAAVIIALAAAGITAMVVLRAPSAEPEPDAADAGQETEETAVEDDEPVLATVVPNGALDQQALEALGAELGARFGETAFEVTDAGAKGSAREFIAVQDGTGKRYELYWYTATGGWQVYEAPLAPVDDPAEIAKQDQFSSLTSKEATFDAEGAVPAWRSTDVKRALGQDYSEAIVSAVGAELKAHGAESAPGRGMYLETSGISRANGKVTFKVMAAAGVDRSILACEADEKTGAVKASLLG